MTLRQQPARLLSQDCVIASNPGCHESLKTSQEEARAMFRVIGAVVVYGLAVWGLLELAEDLSALIKEKSEPTR